VALLIRYCVSGQEEQIALGLSELGSLLLRVGNEDATISMVDREAKGGEWLCS